MFKIPAKTYNKLEKSHSTIVKRMSYKTKNQLHDIEKHSNKERQRCKFCKEKTIYRCKDCKEMLHPECHLSFHKLNIY